MPNSDSQRAGEGSGRGQRIKAVQPPKRAPAPPKPPPRPSSRVMARPQPKSKQDTKTGKPKPDIQRPSKSTQRLRLQDLGTVTEKTAEQVNNVDRWRGDDKETSASTRLARLNCMVRSTSRRYSEVMDNAKASPKQLRRVAEQLKQNNDQLSLALEEERGRSNGLAEEVDKLLKELERLKKKHGQVLTRNNELKQANDSLNAVVQQTTKRISALNQNFKKSES